MQERTYRIGEAAKLLNLKTYVLRFWETEFTQLNPHRTDKGQRLYSEQDVAMLRTIRHLLHERGLTIEGARKILAEQKNIDMSPSGRDAVSRMATPEADSAEVTQPLYSEALTEAVISALQRTGQNGYGIAHDDDDEMLLPDSQTIESIVARVIAAGEGVPPEDDAWHAPVAGSQQHSIGVTSSRVSDSIRNAQGALFPGAHQNMHNERPERKTEIVADPPFISSPAPSEDFSGSSPGEQYSRAVGGVNGMAGHTKFDSESETASANYAAPEPETDSAFVREVIAELEDLRDMLSPRRFK